MISLLKHYIYLTTILIFTLGLAACGGGGSGTTAGTGTLVLGLTDGPGDFLHVFVTIEEIQINRQDEGQGESGWFTAMILDGEKTFDLMELQNGVIAELGLVELEAGHYNQLRLILGTEPDDPAVHPFANYVVIEGSGGEDPTDVELRVLPSELKNGIKIVRGFEIVSQGVTELILDFDAQRSVVQANGIKGWHLKPTIKILETVNNSISGTVVDEAGEDSWLEGVSITAQKYNPEADDLQDEIAVIGSAITNILGDYFIYLPPDTYNIVAAEAGYVPQCQVVTAGPEYANHGGVNFTMTETTVGTVSGTVEGLPENSSAVLSFRQDIACGSDTIPVGVYSIEVAAGSTYEVTLSTGVYQLVASAPEQETREYTITVAENPAAEQDISFP